MIEQLTNATTGRRASRMMHKADRWVLFDSAGKVAHSETVPKLIAQAWVDGKIDRDETIKDLVPSGVPAVNGDLRADLRWISKSTADDRDLIHSLAVDVLSLLTLVEHLTERVGELEKPKTGGGSLPLPGGASGIPPGGWPVKSGTGGADK